MCCSATFVTAFWFLYMHMSAKLLFPFILFYVDWLQTIPQQTLPTKCDGNRRCSWIKLHSVKYINPKLIKALLTLLFG